MERDKYRETKEDGRLCRTSKSGGVGVAVVAVVLRQKRCCKVAMLQKIATQEERYIWWFDQGSALDVAYSPQH
jgi:hypothetical protein